MQSFSCCFLPRGVAIFPRFILISLRCLFDSVPGFMYIFYQSKMRHLLRLSPCTLKSYRLWITLIFDWHHTKRKTSVWCNSYITAGPNKCEPLNTNQSNKFYTLRFYFCIYYCLYLYLTNSQFNPFCYIKKKKVVIWLQARQQATKSLNHKEENRKETNRGRERENKAIHTNRTRKLIVF